MHGGQREGSGRKPGSLNKATQKQREAVEASGLTPLDYMLSVMRDEQANTAARLDAAKAAAPYVHPKLAAIDNTHHGPDDESLAKLYLISDKPMTCEEWERERANRE